MLGIDLEDSVNELDSEQGCYVAAQLKTAQRLGSSSAQGGQLSSISAQLDVQEFSLEI